MKTAICGFGTVLIDVCANLSAWGDASGCSHHVTFLVAAVGALGAVHHCAERLFTALTDGGEPLSM